MLTLEERSMAKDHSRHAQASHQDNASSPTILTTKHQNRPSHSQLNTTLRAEFSMTDLGALNYFLGISVVRDHHGMFLS